VGDEGQEVKMDQWKCLRCGEEFDYPHEERPPACPNPNCRKKGFLKALSGPYSYFDGDRFIPKLLAEELMKEFHFVTHEKSHVMYVYRNGRYEENAEELIETEAQRRLGKEENTHRINEVVEYIRRETYTPAKKFDPPPHLLCLENGILNLETRELMPHSPDIIFLSKVPIKYDPKARCPNVGRYLQEWTTAKNVIRLVQFAGFCLYRSYFIRKAVVLFGRGKNGKTTFIQFLTRWLGPENVSDTSVLKLDQSEFARAHLFGKLANLCDELPPSVWFSTEKFKQLTGGSRVEAEKKFKDPFEFTNYAKILFAANELPSVHDESKAFWDRIMIADFPNVFEGGRQRNQSKILGEMLTEEERSGFLNAALVGLEMLLKFNEFFAQDEIEKVREDYFERSSSVGAFVHTHIVPCEESVITKDELYRRYVEFCRDRGTSAEDKSVFAKKLMRLEPACRPGRRRIDGQQTYVWEGIRYIEQPEVQEQSEIKYPEQHQGALSKLFPYTKVDFNPSEEELMYIKRIGRLFNGHIRCVKCARCAGCATQTPLSNVLLENSYTINNPPVYPSTLSTPSTAKSVKTPFTQESVPKQATLEDKNQGPDSQPPELLPQDSLMGAIANLYRAHKAENLTKLEFFRILQEKMRSEPANRLLEAIVHLPKEYTFKPDPKDDEIFDSFLDAKTYLEGGEK